MLQYKMMVNRQRKWMLYLLAALVLGWGFTDYQEVFQSLLLGASLSFYNLWLLQRKVNKLGQASAENRTMRTFGTVTRLMTGALAVLITFQFHEYFHLISVVIGLMTSYIVIIIDILFQSIKNSRRKRGE